MNRRARLAALQQLAAMKRDHDLARLSRLAAARGQTVEKLDKLAQPVPLAEDPALFAARQAHLAWATAQRRQLNLTLAQQTAKMLDQRAHAARSFGRAEALERLLHQSSQRKTHSP